MPAPEARPPRRYGSALRVRLTPDQVAALAAFAQEGEVSLSTALRLATVRGLRGFNHPGAREEDASEAALAALCAAEHNRLLLELMLPAARGRATELAEQAALNAEARLRTAARTEQQQW